MATEVTGNELAQVLGQTGEALPIKGVQVLIAPLVLTQIADVLVCLDRLSDKGVTVTGAEGVFSKDFNPMKLAFRGGHDFIEILAIASGQSIEWVGKLDALETAKLAGKIWEVNKDFFDRNRAALMEALGPATNSLVSLGSLLLEKLVGKLANLIARVGQGASSASSAPATGSTTSRATPSRS